MKVDVKSRLAIAAVRRAWLARRAPWILFRGFLFVCGQEGIFDHDDPHLQCYTLIVDLYLGPATVVQPDITVFRTDLPGPEEWKDFPIPKLVVEVLSPNTAARDRGEKRDIYQAAGVPEYWIVDIDSRLIERWRPEDERPEILREKIMWAPEVEGERLEIDLEELWPKVI